MMATRQHFLLDLKEGEVFYSGYKCALLLPRNSWMKAERISAQSTKIVHFTDNTYEAQN
jgi:hypothetical protein